MILKEPKLSQEFRRHLYRIWKQSENIVKIQIDDKINKELLHSSMEKIALEFYEKYKLTNVNVELNKSNFKHHHSVWLHTGIEGTGSLNIPKFFVEKAKQTPAPDFEQIFQKEVTWVETLSYMFEETLVWRPAKFTPADLRILQILSRNDKQFTFIKLKKGKIKFPYKIDALSIATRQSKVNTTSRLDWMYDHIILRPYILINPFVLGFDIFLVIYHSNRELEAAKWNYLTLVKQELYTNDHLRIIQYPRHRSNEYVDNIFSFATTIQKIQQISYFQELSDLGRMKEDSFQNKPNYEAISDLSREKPRILFREDDASEWLSILLKTIRLTTFSNNGLKSLSYSDLLIYLPPKRKELILQVVNYIAKYGIPIINMYQASQEIKLRHSLFIAALNYLFEQNLVALLNRITQIDCHNRFGIYLEVNPDVIKDWQQFLNHFSENLLNFPESRIYYGNYFIFAYVALPTHWLPGFLLYLRRTQSLKGCHLSFGLHVSFSSWARFNSSLPEGTQIDEFGISLPDT